MRKLQQNSALTEVRPNGRLVRKLKLAMEDWHGLGGLAKSLHLTRSGLREELDILEILGYELAYHPRLGVRLERWADFLTEAEISYRIRTDVVGSKVVVLDKVTSTNDVAVEMARCGSQEGTTIFAERQTHGRGRLGRVWASPRSKGLWFSTLLRPKLKTDGASLLTIMAAVAISEGIRSELGLPALIRWPNDIIIHGKKVGGVLVEMKSCGTKVPECILGAGVNVNYETEEMPRHIRKIATSLMTELGRPVDRIQSARAMLRSLDMWYQRLRNGDVIDIIDAWRRLSGTLGRNVSIEQHGRQYRGSVVDIDPNGALVLRLRSGGHRIFRSHEITRMTERLGAELSVRKRKR